MPSSRFCPKRHRDFDFKNPPIYTHPTPKGLGPLLPGASDIGQLAATRAALGPFCLEEWPEAAALPDWGKVRFDDDGHGSGGDGDDGSSGSRLAALLPDAPPGTVDLVGALLRCV
jgi:hypothetical protein